MTTVNSGTTLTVTSGQTIDGVIVLKGGLLHVLSGGTIRNTLNNTGWDLIDAGGIAIDTIVSGTQFPGGNSEYGTEYLLSGGSAFGTTLNGGVQEVYGTAVDTIINNGWQSVYSGGTAIGTTVNGGIFNQQIVFAGGTAIDTMVNTGGFLSVYSGGAATDVTLNGGHAAVGGTISGAIVNDGGLFSVVSGVASATTINNGGILSQGGGTIIDTTINGGGQATIYSGTLEGTTTIADGTLELHAPTNPENTGVVVVNGVIEFAGTNGTLQFDDGAIVFDATINDFDAFDRIKFAANHLDAGGFPRFDNGGTVTPGAGNVLHVVENGITYDLQFDPSQNFGGKAFQLVPNYDGVNLVLADVSSVLFGQTISSSQVGTSKIQNVYGLANGTTISFGGYQNVEAGGTTIGTVIHGGGFQEVLGGGLDIGATVLGGNQIVLLGGESLDATINGGVQQVYGTSRQATVNTGYVLVYSGGTAIDTTLNNGGLEFVEYGGTATGTIVNSGGFLLIEDGGAAFGITINSGGIAKVVSGQISDPTINDGTLILQSDAVVDGTIHLSGSGGTLELSSIDPTTTTAQLDASTLTVYTVDVTFQFQIDGANGSTFTLQAGEFGGTDIVFDLPANHRPVVSNAIISNKSEDDPAYTLDLLQFASDPDANDILHVANVTGVTTGVMLEGDTLRINPTAYNSLAVGEPTTITINYDVVDGNGGSVPQTATITINGVNDIPIATPDFAIVQKGGTVTGNVLANDNDPDQDTLLIGGQLIKGRYGILTLNADGSYSYAANINAKTGSQDVLTYSVSDGHISVDESLIVTIQADAGNSLNSARDLGILGSASYLPISEWVGTGDPADYFKFDFSGNERLTLSVTGLHGDVDLFLLNDHGKIIESSQLTGNSSETIWETLTTGTYYVKVQDQSDSTDYHLSLDFSPFSSSTLPSIPLPFDSDYSDMYVTQGWAGNPTHTGFLNYSVDFSRADGPAGIATLSVGNNGTVYDYRDNVADDQSGNSGFGNYITIKYVTSDGNDYFATYMHLKAGSITEALRGEIPRGLQVNLETAKKYADLDVGDTVGKIGDTGGDYAPHLHFQFSDDVVPSAAGFWLADASAANGKTYEFNSNDFPYDGDGRADIPDDSLAAYSDFVGYRGDVDNNFWFV